jgi:hypothetical protein
MSVPRNHWFTCMSIFVMGLLFLGQTNHALPQGQAGSITGSVKEFLWGYAPWHPQYLPSASRFNAKLQAPIGFGELSIPASEFTQLGSEPAPGAIVAARLIPSLDSSLASHGNEVAAVLTRPLFSTDNHLIFPEGSRLIGSVTQAQPARHWHRNGKLAFMFTRMELPSALARRMDASPAQELEGRLDGVFGLQ